MKKQKFDKAAVKINDLNIINGYNARCVVDSTRNIFSVNDNFSVIDAMLKEDADILSFPRTSTVWGGKTFYPSTKKIR